MRFRTSSSSNPYMNRAAQWRMIMMVVSLGVVIFAIRVTSRPEMWARIFPEEALQQNSPVGETAETRFQVIPGQPGIEMDEFLLTEVTTGESPEPEAETEESSSTVKVPEENPPSEDRHDRPEQLDPKLFQSAEDFSVGVRAGEAESYFQLIEAVSQIPAEEWEQKAIPEAAREAMLTAPEQYRGQVMQFEGALRRLEKVEATPNETGVNEYFIGWVITPTSSNIPYRVAAKFVAEDLPIADLIEEEIPVRISGYFFKIQGYHARSDLQLTPLFITQKIARAPVTVPPVSLSEDSQPARWLFVIFGVMFILAIWSVYRTTVGATRMRKKRKEFLESDGDLSFIQGQTAIDPGEELKRLNEAAEHSDEN